MYECTSYRVNGAESYLEFGGKQQTYLEWYGSMASVLMKQMRQITILIFRHITAASAMNQQANHQKYVQRVLCCRHFFFKYGFDFVWFVLSSSFCFQFFLLFSGGRCCSRSVGCCCAFNILRKPVSFESLLSSMCRYVYFLPEVLTFPSHAYVEFISNNKI